MHIQSIVENRLVNDKSSVWRLEGHTEFGYSDGTSSERYLWKVFGKATDLSSRSAELGIYINDWPSEYHLTTKRSQLLSGFAFDRSLRVLEVGCGCGAISRYLGENFDQVVSVEGNINRARLARERTRDLDSVSVICAPFQDIRFSQRFDVVFCIGVFEYSAAFIAGPDPYDAALRYFSNMLTPNGMVVIAIENQFGLKYFSGAREDHLGVMFEGLEGYHRHPSKARTFGKRELEMRLGRYFSSIEFYYPYPDYKVPECVLSSEFLASGRAGELVSHIRSRDYAGPSRALWDEMPATLELNRNGILEFFSNSFLILAGKGPLKRVSFNQLAVQYSSGRRPAYTNQTRVLKGPNGGARVEKRRLNAHLPIVEAPLALIGTDTPWIDAHSVLTVVMLQAYSRQRRLCEIVEPCKDWMKRLLSESRLSDGVRWIDGSHVDSIWGNAYIVDNTCRIIDREWVWSQEIRLNVLVIRAIYDFLCRIEIGTPTSKSLATRRGKSLIQRIAAELGVRLTSVDFAAFVCMESEIAAIVSGSSKFWQGVYVRWFLIDRPTRRFFRRTRPVVSDLLSRFQARLAFG